MARSFAAMSAPLSRRTFTAATFPEAAANMRGEVPLVVAWLGSAPPLSKVSIMASSPFFAASRRGV